MTRLRCLVGGRIGYQPAVSAGVENGQIVLSAGHNVSVNSFAPVPTAVVESNPVSTEPANIEFLSTEFDSNVLAQASGSIDAAFDGAGGVTADGDFILNAATQIDFGGTNGAGADIGGDLELRAGTGSQGGTINILVDLDTTDTDASGRITVGGNLLADVSAAGAIDSTAGVDGEDATGGTIDVSVTVGGVLDVGGDMVLAANAVAGQGPESTGDAFGGSVTVTLDGAASADHCRFASSGCTRTICWSEAHRDTDSPWEAMQPADP